ncbi:hypothetical protein GCM10027429_12370 [Marivirga atlantica]|uniref:DUF1579 domain-containing protein n=1 Tax=Marivirga atlantica TaxID=1548457 RepID=A0A937A9P8_9BACT|nr:hypothetical protein [Marivirga atlantica]MBL0764850.1 hypothetical protein [Marivirga atlantica]
MKKLSILILSLFVFSYLNAQPAQTDQIAKNEVSKLTFMEGYWEGTGWRYSADGQKHSFEQTEKVQFKLDGTAILVEGHGTSNGKTVHDAMAVITYDKEKQNFRFSSNLSDGKGGVFTGEIIDGKFYWYPNDFIRYIITVNNNGQWHEIGEMNRNGNWFQFFEMTLNKQ